MKFLEAGTLRFLLLNREEIDRNYQRRAPRGAVALVAEANPAVPGAFIYHHGFGLMTDGAVALVYEPTGKVAVRPDQYAGRRVNERAAFATYGRIALAETADEAASLVLTAPEETDSTNQTAALADAPTRPSARRTKVSKPEEGDE